jgi:hypothetical protein
LARPVISIWRGQDFELLTRSPYGGRWSDEEKSMKIEMTDDVYDTMTGFVSSAALNAFLTVILLELTFI